MTTTTALIDWAEVGEDATAEELAAADNEQKVEELAVELAAIALDYLSADAEFVLDLEDIKEGIRNAR